MKNADKYQKESKIYIEEPNFAFIFYFNFN